MPTTKRPDPVAPALILTPQDRGQALKAWLKRKDIPVSDFAAAIGIGRATLNRYIAGTKDLATAEQSIADRLLQAMGISDGEAWTLLSIPEDNRRTFRSFRPPPLGHGTVTRTLSDIRLEEPLFGSVALPAGTLIRVSHEGPALEHSVVRLPDGRLYAASAGVIAEGEQLGYLVSAHFAIRLTDAEPLQDQ
ncbi:helix-turn-helix domain-containing protein [Deinococcus arboris]|nr:helix-turn-helix transcriptional regulator [Deinococcus arboris]